MLFCYRTNQKLSGPWQVLTFGKIKYHTTSLFNKNKAKMEQPHVTKSNSIAIKYYFSVWLYQSLTSFWRSFSLLQFIEVCGCVFMHSSHHMISVSMRSGLWLGHSHVLQICWRVWDHCPVAWPIFGQALAVGRMSSHLTLQYFGIRKEFMVDSMIVRCPGPVATKQAQTHQPSTSMCNAWYEAFVLIWSLGF